VPPCPGCSFISNNNSVLSGVGKFIKVITLKEVTLASSSAIRSGELINLRVYMLVSAVSCLQSIKKVN
jgi:hypothetical protein